MQEDITRRTVAISIKAAKLTGRVLAAAFQKVLREMEKERREALRPKGKQTVKQLVGQGPSNTIPLKGSARRFERIARKNGVDYAFRKVGPRDYVLFFKSSQADAITDTLSEFTKRTLKKEKGRASIHKQLQEIGKQQKTRPERVQEKEAVRDGR